MDGEACDRTNAYRNSEIQKPRCWIASSFHSIHLICIAESRQASVKYSNGSRLAAIHGGTSRPRPLPIMPCWLRWAFEARIFAPMANPMNTRSVGANRRASTCGSGAICPTRRARIKGQAGRATYQHEDDPVSAQCHRSASPDRPQSRHTACQAPAPVTIPNLWRHWLGSTQASTVVTLAADSSQ